jgi:hypothetical protein
MKIDALQKWTIAMAAVGGLAASQGTDRHVLDIAVGAGLWAAITYGVGSFVIYLRHKNRR